MTAKSPWWQIGKTPERGFWTGGIWTIAGLIELGLGITTASTLNLIAGAILLAGALAALASAGVLLRRQRSGTGPGAQSAPR